MNLRKRGITWATVFWFILGVLQIVGNWGDAANMNLGLIFIVLATVFAGDTSIECETAGLRYRLGELEHKIEQLERSRGLPQK